MRLESHVMRNGSLRPSNFHVSNFHASSSRTSTNSTLLFTLLNPPMNVIQRHPAMTAAWLIASSARLNLGVRLSRGLLFSYKILVVHGQLSPLTRHVAETRMHECLAKAPRSARAFGITLILPRSVLRVHIDCYCISECHYYDIQNAHRLLEG